MLPDAECRWPTAFTLHCARCNLIKVTFYASWRGKIHYLLHFNSFWRVKTQPLNTLCHSLFVGFGCMPYGVWVYQLSPEAWSLKPEVWYHRITFSRLLAPSSHIVAHMLLLILICVCVCSYVEPLMPLHNIRSWCFWAFLLDYIFSLKIFLEECSNILECIHVPCSVFSKTRYKYKLHLLR